ncbi:MAG TPA: HPr family phosphocarrier protein [Gemmatales bacterium]|nr:HPr family phosphocarrier protein [Gemmatales bacterium]
MSMEGTGVRTVVIHFPVGLHVRPATIIAKKARNFQAEVFLIHEDRKVSTRSPMDMFMLGAEKGTELKLEASQADDAQRALDEIAALFAENCPEMHIPSE